MAPVQLSNVNSTLLPPELTGPIFVKATEQSAVQRLARRIPLSITAQTAIPVPGGVPVADWVTEGQRKPVSSSTVGVKVMSGKKVAVMVAVSQEVANTNPGALFSQLENDLPTAIARAFDFAAIHGRTLTGAPGPFADYLAATGNSVELGTATQAAGGIYADIVDGEALVENANYDFSGFAADPRIRSKLKLSTDTTGRPIFVQDVLTGSGAGGGSGSGSLDGFPIFYNRGVSGVLVRQPTGSRVVTASTSNTSTTLTAATGTFDAGDVGSTVTGTGIPGGTTIATFTDSAHVVMSAAATSTNSNESVTVTEATADTKLRALGGDFSQCAYGVGMDISIRRSDQASYVDTDGTTHSAFQENLVLILAEAYYGFVVSDNAAFVKYTDAS